MLFTFAGSSHTKYTTYLLEFLTTFELESSEALQMTVLNSMLVNLSGKAGGFSAGDIIQEFFNRLLEAIIERKGADFGALNAIALQSYSTGTFLRANHPGDDLQCGGEVEVRDGGTPPMNAGNWDGWWDCP